MKKLYILSAVLLSLFTLQNAIASKLLEVKVVDKDYIHLVFLDGEVTFRDDAQGTCPHDHCEDLDNSRFEAFGVALNTNTAQQNNTYRIKSNDDGTFGTNGLQPNDVFRKSKISGMNQKQWNVDDDDYTYDLPFSHQIYLKLPQSLTSGNTYTVEIAGGTNTDKTSITFTYDINETRSEAIHVNLVGYAKNDAVKAVDLHHWMGDGDARDYSQYIGKKVFLYNIDTKNTVEVGSVSFGASEASELAVGHKMLMSDVWHADFTGYNTPGTYKVVIEDIGCSDEFEISDEVYKDPFGISVLGFFYMRIGQSDYASGNPIPREPHWIPNAAPANCKVYVTTMQPYHPEWNQLCGCAETDPVSGECIEWIDCDEWDIKGGTWEQYKMPGNPTNPNAFGGHSDALDWDRHLGHVSIIYDMLLPYIISGGAQSDDNLGIAESGNGIPDLLDEAQNEVDFWLRLRDQNGGYSHGLTNPDDNNALYQAGVTAVAAWANAANSAMMSQAYQIAGQTELMEVYRDSAVAAYTYASNLPDQQLDKTQGVGIISMSGEDFKNTAAAFLYNVTGNSDYEIDYQSGIGISNGTSQVTLSNIYAVAGYLFTPQTIHYQTLWDNIKTATIYHAKVKEANYSQTRPTRRGIDNNIAWMQTEIGIHRTIVAHAISDNGADKDLFLDALTLEADYSLGRNPENRILMTTATTSLENERSIENAFTSGWDDGSPGVHPGHTPYMNPYSWGGNRYMGNPSKLADQSYPNANAAPTSPAQLQWPMGEMYFNTRFVYAHSEFTPQQTMRGKTALYAYLYGLGPACDKPSLGQDVSICGLDEIELNTGLSASGRTFVWEGPSGVINGANGPTVTVSEIGEYTVTVDESGCVKSDRIEVKGEIPSVFLGDDFNLCDVASKTLDAGVSGEGYTYSWEKDGDLIDGAEEKTYEAKTAGNYTVIVDVVGCGSKLDDITITSSLVDVKHDSICGEGEAELVINESGTFSWHAGPDTDDLISDQLIYRPNITESTTFYVEKSGSVTSNVGAKKPGASTWGDWAGAFEDRTAFTVLTTLDLTSVKVDVRTAGIVKVNLYKDGNKIDDYTQSVSIAGLNQINVNFQDLEPGSYSLNLTGTTASLTLDNEEGDYVAYPYVLANIMTIDHVIWEWGTMETRIMFLYDFEVSYTGSSCVRTPVESVVLDPTHQDCNVLSSSDESIEEFTIYPNPTTDIVHFSKEVSFEIMDAMGQQLIKSEADKVDLSIYPSGVYLIKTASGVSKIVKQ